MDREAWRAAIHGVRKNQTRLNEWTELTELILVYPTLERVLLFSVKFVENPSLFLSLLRALLVLRNQFSTRRSFSLSSGTVHRLGIFILLDEMNSVWPGQFYTKSDAKEISQTDLYTHLIWRPYYVPLIFRSWAVQLLSCVGDLHQWGI